MHHAPHALSATVCTEYVIRFRLKPGVSGSISRAPCAQSGPAQLYSHATRNGFDRSLQSNMKVTFRTVTGTSFSLDLEDKSKVGRQHIATDIRNPHNAPRKVTFLLVVQVSDVKAKVQQERGDGFPAAHQVLIFQGKVGQVPDGWTNILQ